MTGVEPANDGVTIHCLNLLATPAINTIIIVFLYYVYVFNYEYSV